MKKMSITEAMVALNTIDPPITEEWLKANDFKLAYWNDPQRAQHRIRRLSNHLLLEVAPNDYNCDDEPNYFVWLVQEEPKRHIHVFHMVYRRQLIKLCEALTDKDWMEASAE